MNITELLGTKQYRNLTDLESDDAVQKFMDAGGYKKLGSGAFATVYEKDGTAIKFWKTDGGYEAFIDFCLKNKSEHLPKFLSKIKKIKHPNGDRFSYIKMEKLTPVQDKTVVYGVRAYDLSSNFTSWFDNASKKISDGSNMSAIALYMETRVEKKYPNLTENDVDKIIGFLELALRIHLEADYDKVYPDMHYENVMLRGQTLVITDPFNDPYFRD